MSPPNETLFYRNDATTLQRTQNAPYLASRRALAYKSINDLGYGPALVSTRHYGLLHGPLASTIKWQVHAGLSSGLPSLSAYSFRSLWRGQKAKDLAMSTNAHFREVKETDTGSTEFRWCVLGPAFSTPSPEPTHTVHHSSSNISEHPSCHQKRRRHVKGAQVNSYTLSPCHTSLHISLRGSSGGGGSLRSCGSTESLRSCGSTGSLRSCGSTETLLSSGFTASPRISTSS